MRGVFLVSRCMTPGASLCSFAKKALLMVLEIQGQMALKQNPCFETSSLCNSEQVA